MDVVLQAPSAAECGECGRLIHLRIENPWVPHGEQGAWQLHRVRYVGRWECPYFAEFHHPYNQAHLHDGWFNLPPGWLRPQSSAGGQRE
jgi:hypothetical protein